ncbi:MAG: hypothetical protein EOO27_32015 [Comamonadaceae bacterium]|nr:MAG: hypothetical protein EOO27_32015 [Comamonadaceae bacterium]
MNESIRKGLILIGLVSALGASAVAAALDIYGLPAPMLTCAERGGSVEREGSHPVFIGKVMVMANDTRCVMPGDTR